MRINYECSITNVQLRITSFPIILIDFGFGAYNFGGNNDLIEGIIGLGNLVLTRFNPLLGVLVAGGVAKYGENPLSRT